jgi:hypothetical protein
MPHIHKSDFILRQDGTVQIRGSKIHFDSGKVETSSGPMATVPHEIAIVPLEDGTLHLLASKITFSSSVPIHSQPGKLVPFLAPLDLVDAIRKLQSEVAELKKKIG